jgi:LysM repeat protein
VTETVVTQAGLEVPPAGQPSELRYLVKPGDTLWDIAVANYDDVGGGMRAIRLRNGLKRQKVLAGEVLVIPLEGGGDPR